MEFKCLIILLFIQLSLAHRYHNIHSDYDSYSDEDYSEELPEPPKPIRKHNVQVQKNVAKETPKPIVNNNPKEKVENKKVPQYEVTENVEDVPNDNTVNGRIDPRFMLNKPLNQVVDTKATANEVTAREENKGTVDRDNELKRLEKEYLSIVRMLENNKNLGSREKMIDLTEISKKLTSFWNNVKEIFSKMADDVGNSGETIPDEIDNAHSFLYKLHKTSKDVVTKVGSFFRGK